MVEDETYYNQLVFKACNESEDARRVVLKIFLSMNAVQQMLAYLYQVVRAPEVDKNRIYSEFFQTPFVKRYCDQEGIEEATPEAAKHRCPFLLNILEATGAVSIVRSSVNVLRLLLTHELVKQSPREDFSNTDRRYQDLLKAWPNKEDRLESADVSILRELFGSSFLTDDYFLKELIAADSN